MPTYCRAHRAARSHSIRQGGKTSQSEILLASDPMKAKDLLGELGGPTKLAHNVNLGEERLEKVRARGLCARALESYTLYI